MKFKTQLVDDIHVDKYDETPEGYLVFKDIKISRVGLQDYKGYELGLEFDDDDYDKTFVVYRAPDEVFSEDSLKSLTMKPVTNDHPWELLNSTNHQEWAKGTTGSTASKAEDGEHVLLDQLLITDSELVSDFKMGLKTELSVGYIVGWDETPGITHDGKAYDLKQTNIRGNHVAVVARGRCGQSCNLTDSDGQNGNNIGEPMNKVQRLIDGTPVQIDESSVAILDSVLAKLEVSEEKNATLQTVAVDTETKLKEDHIKVLATKDAEIVELKKNQINPATLDALANIRAGVIATAKSVLGDEYKVEDVACSIIKKDIVAKFLGDSADPKQLGNETYVDTFYSTIQKDSKGAGGANTDTTEVVDDDNALAASLTKAFGEKVGDSGVSNTAREVYLKDLTSGTVKKK